MRQFLRKVELLIAEPGGNPTVAVFKDLKIEFDVQKNANGEPNTATIRVWNLSATTSAFLIESGKDLVLQAGYEGDGARLIFRGQLTRAFEEREGTDIIMNLECGDGQEDYSKSYTNKTIPAGTSNRQVCELYAGDFKSGTKLGEVQIDEDSLVRGKVVVMPTRRAYAQMARSQDAEFSIQDGQLVLIKKAELRSGEIVSADALKIERMDEGFVRITMLLNAYVSIGGGLQARMRDDTGAIVREMLVKVSELQHVGDNREGTFLTVAVGKPI